MSVFGRQPGGGTAALPVEGRLPGFGGATGWLNSTPLTGEYLRGRIVLTDFWTYTCINWLRTLTYVRAWAQKYGDQGLVVVGVHTPEFPFEQDAENVRSAARVMGIHYPIALDRDFAVWDAFANRYWPAVYIADAEGRIRHHQFGEGGYDGCERIIQQLLGEAGHHGFGDDLVSVSPQGFEAQADWENLGSPETYLGHQQGFASPGGVVIDEPHIYVLPESLELNRWALSGNWTVERSRCRLNRADGQISFRFHARDVHLVMRSHTPGASVPFRVLVDGARPGANHGLDVDEDGHGTLVRPRLYQLVRQQGPITEATFEITFMGPGVEAYVFTFG